MYRKNGLPRLADFLLTVVGLLLGPQLESKNARISIPFDGWPFTVAVRQIELFRPHNLNELPQTIRLPINKCLATVMWRGHRKFT
jgi:hypothetical protein